MNQRPTRAPAPPSQDARNEVAEAEFAEAPAARPAAQLPAVHRTTETAIETSKTVSERPDPVEEPLPATGPGAVITAIAAIMAELKPVEKSGWNDFHKYWHVRMQDLSRELTPLMGKHGIVVFQTEEGRELFDGGNVVAVRYRFTVVHKSGAIWPQRPLQTGVSACRNRGGFDDKTLNKCHTSARKYFLLSLFQIASDDAEDADSGPGEQRQRPQGSAAPRRAPSPDGKVKPHILPVIEGELPEAWRDRFIKAIAKATPSEVDSWYDENFVVFEKLKKGGFTTVYANLIDAMDKQAGRTATEETAQADPISSGLPGKPDTDKLWLESLDNAFGACEDAASLSAEQLRLMTPMKGKIGGNVWNEAVDLVKTHLDRITAEG